MMKSFPLFAVLRGRRVVIAGGGEEAVRKAALFGRAKADLVVVAADIDRAAFEAAGVQARFVARDAEPEDFAGAFIVVVADAGDAYAEALARTARAAGALVNVVDRPALCDFTTPSIVDRGDVVVAISTNGTAPVLGAKLRAVVEAAAPPRLGALAAFAGSFRDAVAAAVPKASRRRFWTTFFRGPI
ncbi:MAG: bifunctional precorrin-2 dehydrogenase/sirohydrochlorin ferrochelatase, partial [Pseudomonadota bacterium]